MSLEILRDQSVRKYSCQQQTGAGFKGLPSSKFGTLHIKIPREIVQKIIQTIYISNQQRKKKFKHEKENESNQMKRQVVKRQ